MLLATFAAIEALARLTHHFLYGEYADGLPATEVEPANQGPVGDDAPPDSEQMTFLHPFYGYVSKELADGRPLKPGQRRGKDVALPRQGQGDALVVAIIGGSVADEVAGELHTALLRHLSATHALTHADPHAKLLLVNLANPGYHQPQQAMVLANVLATGARIDIVVNLDGFNDVTMPGYQARVLGPYGLFHRTWAVLASVSGHRAQIASIRALREEERALLDARPWEATLYRSAIFGLWRRFRLDRIGRLIVLGHHEMADGSHVRPRMAPTTRPGRRYGFYGLVPPRATGYVGPDDPAIGPESWYRSSRLMAGVTKRSGTRYYHFLQPSQYARSKPLSDEELATAFDPEHRYAREFSERHPLLVEYGRRLRAEGVKFFDLSRIFSEHRETLYVDTCCHLNKRGNELLAEHMMRRIIANEGGLGGEVAVSAATVSSS